MSTHSADSGRDTVEVDNRLDKVVLAVVEHDAGTARTVLTAEGAREIAGALERAADTAERTQAS
jgi:hypothetical protein